jgi:hypothetical protein
MLGIFALARATGSQLVMPTLAKELRHRAPNMAGRGVDQGSQILPSIYIALGALAFPMED